MPTTRAMTAAQVAGGSNAAQSGSNAEPPRKKARGTKAVTGAPKKSRKLSLSRLLDLPPEVFSEIATHLLPVDLLSLARSNKFFRRIFMSRTSQYLWKAAMAHILGMPACPPKLSEPQYISLLYSKTCSNCGAKVIRRMDPYLLVRLCNSCRDELTKEIYLWDRLFPLLPRSHAIRAIELGGFYTFRSEYDDAKAVDEYEDEASEIYKARLAAIDKRQDYGAILEDFLDQLDYEREDELKKLKLQRWDQIKDRIAEGGWTLQDMNVAPQNAMEWRKLVAQPKPITDRIWANLYPKLLPLLRSNREHREGVEKEKRRRERIKKLETMATSLRKALPPLVHVTFKLPPQDQVSASSSSTAGTHLPGDYPDVRAEMPFPTTAELLTWPIIKDIVENDTSPEDAEAKLAEIRNEVDRRVVEWREKIEQDLIDIWNAGRDASGQDMEQPEPSSSKGKGKAVARTTKRTTRKTKGQSVNAKGSTSMSTSHAVELNFPEFVVTFAKPDGTTTTNLSELPPNLQILLRADTTFKGDIDRNYPAIVPRFLPYGMMLGFSEDIMYGKRWDPSKLVRDDECAAIAKGLLGRVGRSDASSVEMQALGANFRCGRCTLGLPDNWKDLVAHYCREQNQWKKAQEKILSEPKSLHVYHNTHDLKPGDVKPFAHFMTPTESADYSMEYSMHDMPMMKCIKCESMGVEARYFHAYQPELESPIVEHLRDVHDVMDAVPGLHFRRWEFDVNFFDPYDEEDSYDSEEDDDMWDLTGWLGGP